MSQVIMGVYRGLMALSVTQQKKIVGQGAETQGHSRRQLLGSMNEHALLWKFIYI